MLNLAYITTKFTYPNQFLKSLTIVNGTYLFAQHIIQ